MCSLFKDDSELNTSSDVLLHWEVKLYLKIENEGGAKVNLSLSTP